MLSIIHAVLAAILGSGGSAAPGQSVKAPVRTFGAGTVVQAKGGANGMNPARKDKRALKAEAKQKAELKAENKVDNKQQGKELKASQKTNFKNSRAYKERDVR